jgi:hypothetical protein
MNRLIVIGIVFLFILIIFYFINKILSDKINRINGIKENFYIYPKVTTWTPYIIDWMRQPGYSNYFYNNSYMYPIY